SAARTPRSGSAATPARRASGWRSTATAGARFPRRPNWRRPPARPPSTRRRCDAAGRDWSAIDITFTNFEGGSPADDAFNADAYLDGLDKLAKLGVTWVSVHLPGDSMTHALETLDRFRTLVIDVG